MRRSFRLVCLACLLAGLGLPHARADGVDDAQALLRKGQASQALERVDGILKQDPKDIRARFLRGVILSEQQKANEAAIPKARSAPLPRAVEDLRCTRTVSEGPIDWSTRSAKPVPSRVGAMRPSKTSSSGSSSASGMALGKGRFWAGRDVGAPAKCSNSSRLDGRGSSGCGENGLTNG